MPSSSAADATATSAELHLLIDLSERGTRPYWRKILAGSLGVHALVFTAGIRMNGFVSRERPEPKHVVQTTKLYFPKLTQRAPNRSKPTETIDVNSLLATDKVNAAPSTARPSRRFEAPPLRTESPKQQSTQSKTQTPAPDVHPAPTPGAANGLALNLQPPPAPTPDQPFQNIGSEPDVRPEHPAIPIPKATVDNAIRSLASSGSGAHLQLGDDATSTPSPGGLASNAQSAVQRAAVELESDPQGADLRPYLLSALRIIKANWRRVLPESARLGLLRGRTTVQIAMDRDGSILKLVVADSSGSAVLDRAAVAGVSMSDRLPPLPRDFKGEQLRIAFTFTCQPNNP